MVAYTSAHCTACDSQAVTADRFYYNWGDRRFVIYRCSNCTHQFVYPPVSPTDQAAIYGDNYFASGGDWACGIFAGGYAESEAELVAEAQQILEMLPVRAGRLLDIGCAGGVFLNEARKRGFSVQGIELNESMAAHARTNYHLEVLNLRLEDVPTDHWFAAFDVVTLLDCLEHVPQPLELVRKISHWMRPGGALLIRGPLANSAIARFKESVRRVLRIDKRLAGYPLDANMFNKRSLTTLLELCSFNRPVWIGETSSFSNVVSRRKE